MKTTVSLIALCLASALAALGCKSKQATPPAPAATAARLAASAAPGARGAAAPEAPDAARLTPQELKEQAERVVKGFLTAPTCADRVPFVLNPQKNGPIILNYYSAVGCKVLFKSLDSSDCEHPTHGFCTVKATMLLPGPAPEQADDESHAPLATPRGPAKGKGARKAADKAGPPARTIIATDGGQPMHEEAHDYCVSLQPTPKVDWRCTKGYNPVSLQRFKTEHDDARAGKFRLFAQLGDAYLDQYKNKQSTVLAIRLRDMDGTTINGYIERANQLGKFMGDLLKDKKTHKVVLELNYSRNNEDREATAILTLFGVGWREFPAELED
jgi:hypothetical protein